MHIISDRAALELWVAQMKSQRKTIGFVPTMGALHPGHVSLIHQSKLQNDVTICSVFVNPTQFDNPEDLVKYPRNSEKDAELLRQAGCDAVFFPSVSDMYPDETKSDTFDFKQLENQMEGQFRKGHFDGVATIVSKFLEMVRPDKAYFGEKDFQQLRIIQELVQQKNYPVQIVPMPILRESSGLAMSSRNARLTDEFKKEAVKIYKILKQIKDWKKELNVAESIQKAEEAFSKSSLELEYLMICDENTLMPVDEWNQAENIRAFVAAYAGKIRLIDNMKII